MTVAFQQELARSLREQHPGLPVFTAQDLATRLIELTDALGSLNNDSPEVATLTKGYIASRISEIRADNKGDRPRYFVTPVFTPVELRATENLEPDSPEARASGHFCKLCKDNSYGFTAWERSN